MLQGIRGYGLVLHEDLTQRLRGVCEPAKERYGPADPTSRTPYATEEIASSLYLSITESTIFVFVGLRSTAGWIHIAVRSWS